ncbi:MAG: carbamoyltransferase C-terminal domain-containing protein, partial [Blastocatellia bacterium]
NTSFNENEPIVRTAEEAIDCFMRTRMDALVLGNRIIVKRALRNGVVGSKLLPEELKVEG